MFTGACDPPEKLSLALVPPSNVLRMIVKLAYSRNCRTREKPLSYDVRDALNSITNQLLVPFLQVSRREKAIQKLELELLSAQENHRRALDDVRQAQEYENSEERQEGVMTQEVKDREDDFIEIDSDCIYVGWPF